MSLPLVTIRPEPGASETVARGRELGLTVESWPLSRVRPLLWEAPDAAEFDGLLLGSANAVRHAGEQLRQLSRLPVYAVGEQTAASARAAGLQVVWTGTSDLQSLLDALAGQRSRLLRLTGEKHVAVEPPAGITITAVPIYTVEHLPIAAPFAERLRQGAIVLLHSGEASRHFAAECDRLSLSRESIALAALAPRIASAAGEGWRDMVVADEPQDGALLKVAARLARRR